MRVLFMGTPELARTVLISLCEAGHEIVAAVTQPDKEKGRGKTLQASPVKEEAVRRGIPVLQPRRLKNPEEQAALQAFLEENPADVGVVAAFGQILPQAVLDMPRNGCLNVHASLLPKYRGASPIQQTILEGEAESGVTIMQMDAGLDTGDILLQEAIPLSPEETGDSLEEKLADLGGRLIAEALALLEEGRLSPQPQSGDTCYAGMIRKEQGQIDWAAPAEMIERKIRAFAPWPSAYTFRNGKRLQIWKAALAEGREGAAPGFVTAVTKKDFTVQAGDGALRILRVQPEGKKEMEADAYLRGYPLQEGDRLG
ncbi:MAG: methionyl-tRNA formyltransferase [Lachnospiraceae bacterium]|nr:methionyl-tRNA formyltransferase [Lachnospiraceae bacterium]